MSISGLKISDDDFVVEGLINRAPPNAMLRELVVNAIEATCLAPLGQRRIEIGPTIVNGVRKLRIWNTGPGLTADELMVISDLSASVRKSKSLEGNFGLGAKVCSLASNTYGVRYRSCRDGRVHEMTLGKRGGNYGRVLKHASDGTMRPIIDVTADAIAHGNELSFDWTEVVTLGSEADQDTLLSPYGPKMPVSTNWIAEDLYHRIFRLDDSIDLILYPGAQPFCEPRRFETIDQRFRSSSDKEVVEVDGARLHVFFDPPKIGISGGGIEEHDALHNIYGMVGLVYQDEIYSGLTGSGWSSAAAAFGIPFGARYVTLLLELDRSSGVVPDVYRQFLRRRDGSPDGFTADRFAAQIHSMCPDWLRGRLSALADRSQLDMQIKQEVAELAEKLCLQIRASEVALTLVSTQGHHFVIPEVLLLSDGDEIEARWLLDRAAEYSASTDQLFLNCTYPPVLELCEGIEAALKNQIGILDSRLLFLARDAAERCFTRRVLRSLVFVHAKRNLPHLWSEEHCEKMTSPEALSTASEDLSEEVGVAVLYVKSQLQPVKENQF